ncbi:MAG: hypothetical protein MK098_08125 [Marinovum sp.]|nr:hypothetical protein [Marinovum sp.]
MHVALIRQGNIGQELIGQIPRDAGLVQDVWGDAKQSQSEVIAPSAAVGGLYILRNVLFSGDARMTYSEPKTTCGWLCCTSRLR